MDSSYLPHLLYFTLLFSDGFVEAGSPVAKNDLELRIFLLSASDCSCERHVSDTTSGLFSPGDKT